MGKGLYINDSIHGLISLSEFEKRIISSMEFNRLHDVYQNSTVYLTFPSNRTKRFEHSVGTMTLCSKMFYCAIQNSDYDILDSFYKAIHEEVKAIVQDIAHDFKNSYLNSKLLKVPNPEKEPLIPAVTKDDTFRNSLVPYKVKDNFKDLHLLLIQSVRVAALLHDIGHPPFSHVVENSLKEAYKENIEKIDKNSNTQTFINTLGRYIGPDAMGELHEQIGKEISTSILCDIIPFNKDVTYDDNENLFEILVFKTVDKILSNEGLIGILHTIIDGSLDGDRLDYVTRDSLNSGLDVGKIDYKRIINEMQIRYVSIEDEKFSFCVPYKALSSVEDFLKRRYKGYKDIIFHHRAIKTDFLLGETVKQLIQLYLDQDSLEFAHNKNNCRDYISDIIPYNIS